MSTETSDSPTVLTENWYMKNLDVTGAQAAALHDAFMTREQFLSALRDGANLTAYDGIGEKTADAAWEWFHEVHEGAITVDGVLVLDDDGLHLPDWLVGYVGTFTVDTPNITMRPTTTDEGLGEVSQILAAYPDSGTWNERLSEGQIAISTPGHEEMIYEIDDQRTEDEA